MANRELFNCSEFVEHLPKLAALETGLRGRDEQKKRGTTIPVFLQEGERETDNDVYTRCPTQNPEIGNLT